jgi:Recombination endonuclease VII
MSGRIARPELAHLKSDSKEYLAAYYELIKTERRDAEGGAECSRCGIFKPWPTYSDRQTQCKPCRSAIESERYEHNKKRMRDRARERAFGLEPGQYDEMLVGQGGVCAICGQPETSTYNGNVRALAVDHDHSTDEVRGLLCFACNSRLHTTTTEEWLLAAANYLRQS